MTESQMEDPRPGYWLEYSNLQHVKHALIRSYLAGWFPKLGSWAGRIIYLDTHAGRGLYAGGEEGSPVVALRTFLDHSYRDQILGKSEVRFLFVESDPGNVESLKAEIGRFDLPSRVFVDVSCGDCFEQLKELLESLERSSKKLAPAFMFIDPYGFKVPGHVLRSLMTYPRVELFINVIWRELDMGISHGRANPEGGMATTLDKVFDGRKWCGLAPISWTPNEAR